MTKSEIDLEVSLRSKKERNKIARIGAAIWFLASIIFLILRNFFDVDNMQVPFWGSMIISQMWYSKTID